MLSTRIVNVSLAPWAAGRMFLAEATVRWGAVSA